MPDTVDAAIRSRIMSAVRGQDTRPEILIRRKLHRNGFRYRLNVRNLPGLPDIVFPKWNVVLFVHGCYWHRHEGCRNATTPRTNYEFWQEKFSSNIQRDRRNITDLQELGWRVGIVWECAIGKEPTEALVEGISTFIRFSDGPIFTQWEERLTT